jgi:hypothetical protein
VLNFHIWMALIQIVICLRCYSSMLSCVHDDNFFCSTKRQNTKIRSSSSPSMKQCQNAVSANPIRSSARLAPEQATRQRVGPIWEAPVHRPQLSNKSKNSKHANGAKRDVWKRQEKYAFGSKRIVLSPCKDKTHYTNAQPRARAQRRAVIYNCKGC